MTQALNLALFANFVNASGQVSASGIQAGAIPPPFPAGTLMLFQQTSAPTGWTKQTTHDNKALRVVNGTAGSGGTTAFTSVFTNQTVTTSISGTSGATTLSLSQIPSHTHTYGPIINVPGGGGNLGLAYTTSYNGPYDGGTGAAGGGGSHSHSVSGSGTSSAVTLNVAYVDLIIASKN